MWEFVRKPATWSDVIAARRSVINWRRGERLGRECDFETGFVDESNRCGYWGATGSRNWKWRTASSSEVPDTGDSLGVSVQFLRILSYWYRRMFYWIRCSYVQSTVKYVLGYYLQYLKLSLECFDCETVLKHWKPFQGRKPEII